MDAAARHIAEQLDRSAPDVIVAFLDDHFENHFRGLMPSFPDASAVSMAMRPPRNDMISRTYIGRDQAAGQPDDDKVK